MVTKKQSSSGKTSRDWDAIPTVDVEDPPQLLPITVGIGASAGGHEALECLFSAIPSDCTLSFVVVMHLPPDGPSLLPDIIRKYTSMQVLTARDGMPLCPNTIHVPPPGKDLTVSGGRLLVLAHEREARPHHPIDQFFISLAADLGERAVAVVLSGFGSDGSEGVKRIKEGGGIVLVQDPETAINSPMPQNAIATGVADSVLPTEEIAARLVRIAEENVAFPPQTAPEAMDEQLKSIFSVLQTRTSHDFSSYKRNTILRRIERRMMVNGARELSEYLTILEKHPQEAHSLCQELLIGVTSFFRDPDAFELLGSKILPLLFANRNNDEPVRIWHACCATGEEAYSVAILILEFLEKENLPAKVQIFASDLDEVAVAQARAGLYSDDISAGVGKERLKRFFVKSEGGWQVTKQLREMIVFAHHNLIKDPPFSRLDLLVCRNFLIYLNPNIQKLLIPLFHQVLNLGGYLFLGSAETVGPHNNLFIPVDKKWRIFMRQGGKHKVETLFPFSGPISKHTEIDRSIRSFENQESATVNQADKILMERYVPARVIINDKNEVVHFSKQAGLYLLMPEGKPTRDLLKMAREELRPALRAAIYKAFSSRQEITYQGIKTVTERGKTTINISVLPLMEPPQSGRQALVIIEPAVSSSVQFLSSEEVKPGDDVSRNALTRHLEEQLRVTSEQLQSTCEQLETSNERFTLANEELMTVNEELQSTNEELQSTNEELVTVNSELQRKMEELNQSNSDLENLFTSSEVAIVFLDRELSIKRFSSTMGAVLNLTPNDIGRAIHHINITIDLSTLLPDSKQVLENLVPVEREVTSKDGRSFIMQVLPYRATGGGIDGTVVKLTDISERKLAEITLQESEKRFRTMANAIPQLAWIAGPDGSISWYNQRWYDYTGTTPAQMEGWGWQSVHDPEVLPRVLEKWRESISTGEPFDMEFPLLGANGEFRWFLTLVLPLKDAKGKIIQWFGTNTDVTEIKEAEKGVKEAAEQRRLTLEAAELGAWDYNFATGDVFWDKQCRDMWGIREGDRIDYTLAIDQIHPEDREEVDEAVRKALSGVNGGVYHREFRVVWPDGSEHWIVSHGRVYTEGEGNICRPVRFIGVNRETTEQKRAEAMQARLAAIVESSEDAVVAKDLDSIILSWNAGAERIFGYPSEEVIGRPISLLIPPEMHNDEQRMLQRLLAGERITHFETVRLTKDGRRIDVSLTVSLIKDHQGRTIGISKIARDITERKKAEMALRENRAKLEAALASMTDAVFISDTTGKFIEFNDAFASFHRFESKAECLKKLTDYPDILDVFMDTGERAPLEMWAVPRALRGETVTNAVYTLRRKDTGETWVGSYSFAPIRNIRGEIVGSVVVGRDITEIKQKEEALRLSEQRRTLTLEAAQVGTWEWDLKTNENVWSNELWHLYGLKPHSCKPSYEEWLKVIHPEDRSKTEQVLQEAVLCGSSYNTEWRVKLSDGRERWLMSRGRPLKDSQNQIVRYLGIVMDITEPKRAERERKALQEQLIQAQKMEAIGTLAGGIAHDFNNILSAILGYAELVQVNIQPGSMVADDIKEVIKASHRAKDLVQQILAFSRQAETHKIAIRPAVPVKESIKLLRSSLPTTIEIRQDITETQPILADPTQIHQIMMNLCTNAYHAMEETGGTLFISLKNKAFSRQDLKGVPDVQPGNFVQLSIRDTGSGIAPEIKERIFDPYFTTKETGKGTGMGLAMVHGIVKNSGGFVTWQSEIGEGTVFEINLPALQDQITPETREVDAIPVGAERILFIDDEEMLVNMGQAMLERLGYRVTVQMSSTEALNIFQNQPDAFDLVITDQTMPAMTGFDLARRMLQIRPDLPIILCTGYSNQISEDKVKYYGIKGFVMKPLARKDIAALIRKVLDERKNIS